MERIIPGAFSQEAAPLIVLLANPASTRSRRRVCAALGRNVSEAETRAPTTRHCMIHFFHFVGTPIFVQNLPRPKIALFCRLDPSQQLRGEGLARSQVRAQLSRGLFDRGSELTKQVGRPLMCDDGTAAGASEVSRNSSHNKTFDRSRSLSYTLPLTTFQAVICELVGSHIHFTQLISQCATKIEKVIQAVIPAVPSDPLLRRVSNRSHESLDNEGVAHHRSALAFKQHVA